MHIHCIYMYIIIYKERQRANKIWELPNHKPH